MKKVLYPILFLFAAVCNAQTDAALRQKADELAHRFVIFDTHVDLPWRLYKKMEDVSVATKGGNFDYPRAKAGGLSAPFMSIYVPSSFQKTKGGAKLMADTLIDLVVNLTKKNPEKFALAYSADDVEKNFKKGLISFPMGMENGAPIEDNIENVAYFQKRGVRYITLTHAEDNLICGTSYSLNNKWNGLSPFGKKVVEEMNRVGIMIDVSHVSDQTIEQVLQISKTPLIASHSSCRSFTPRFMRNLPDNLIKKIAEKGGVVNINFGSMFLDSVPSDDFLAQRQHMLQWSTENSVKSGDPRYSAHSDEYEKAHPMTCSTVERVADHIEHIVKLVGVNHVGFGSDFDGVGDALPTGLKDVSMYPNLIFALLKRGFKEKDIEKICFKNNLRVWKKVEAMAKK